MEATCNFYQRNEYARLIHMTDAFVKYSAVYFADTVNNHGAVPGDVPMQPGAGLAGEPAANVDQQQTNNLQTGDQNQGRTVSCVLPPYM